MIIKVNENTYCKIDEDYIECINKLGKINCEHILCNSIGCDDCYFKISGFKYINQAKIIEK